MTPEADAHRESVVITGAGLVCCLGLTLDETWQQVLQGHSGIGPLTALESTPPGGAVGGEAPAAPRPIAAEVPREVTYLKMAITSALRAAGIDGPLPYPPHRCALLLGTTLHGMRAGGRFLRTGDHETLRPFLAGSVMRQAAASLGLRGAAMSVCSACSSGLSSVALSVTLLQEGQYDLVITGGYDPISEYAYGGFNSMRLVAPGNLRPFSRHREGMKLGEGYGIVIVERSGDASSRGATALVRIAGFGESCDTHHLSQPHPEGDGAARAMTAAIRAAGLRPGDINLIAAHATGTPDNDAAEFAALSRVFNEALPSIPVVAFKSHVAHTLGGAGAVELILSAMALRDQVVPPCAGVLEEEIEFEGLRVTWGDPRRARLRSTLNASLGFGGSNATMVLEALPQAQPAPVPAQANRAIRRQREVLITGVGVIAPGAVGNDAFATRFSGEHPRLEQDTGAVDDSELGHLLNARRVRRMSQYVKLTLAATAIAYEDAGIEDSAAFGASCSAMLGTAHGSTTYSERYYRQIVEEGIEAANPLLFAEGVPNAASAHLSTMLSIKGLCQTIIGSRTAGLDALSLAFARIRAGTWDRAIVSAADEYSRVVADAYAHFGLHRSGAERGAARHGRGFLTGCGAATLILENRECAERRGVQGRALVGATAGTSWLAGPPREAVGAAGQVVLELGTPDCWLVSVNDTWLDCIELAALRGGRLGRTTTVSSLYGYLAECFSAGPLAAVAAVLLTGRLPSCRIDGAGENGPGAGWGRRRRLIPARGDEQKGPFGVLCTDYAGRVAGVRIDPAGGGRSVFPAVSA